MNKEQLFLQYLDQQLEDSEVEMVENLLTDDPDARIMFEEVKARRQSTLEALDRLNPGEDIIMPPFEGSKKPGQKFYMKPNFLRYAAAIALLLAFSLSFWLNNRDEAVEVVSSDNIQAKTEETSPSYTDELDCYISPNRCWNKRQLVWTVIDIND